LHSGKKVRGGFYNFFIYKKIILDYPRTIFYIKQHLKIKDVIKAFASDRNCQKTAGRSCIMNKLELIAALKNEANISKTDAAKVVEIFFGNMADALASGERVEIRGLCSFFVKHYKSYTGRNPKTGEKVTITPKKLPFFKCGKELKERVDY
jgi:integration host factor subunit beta